MLLSLLGHKNKDYKVSIALSPTDAYVVSGSEEGKIYFWDLMTQKIVMTLQHGTEKSVVYALDYFSEHSCLLSAGSVGNVKLWKGDNWPEGES